MKLITETIDSDTLVKVYFDEENGEYIENVYALQKSNIYYLPEDIKTLKKIHNIKD